MRITIIGCGRWGSFIAWYLNRTGHNVTLYGRDTSSNMQRFLKERSNDLLVLPPEINLSTDIKCTEDADIIVISVNSQGLRTVFKELQGLCLDKKTFVLCMKGLEVSTGKRLSQVATEYLKNNQNVAVWLGPGHVQEFYKGNPNCMVIDSNSDRVKDKLIAAFSSELIRFYYGTDLIGNEIGAASKNVIGIAAGMLDGLGLSSLKGALMSRGTREIARLVTAMGGNELSAYGLCHLGDYEATVFSEYSHNRKFGELFVKNKAFGSLAEGYETCKALKKLSVEYKVELPICNGVYECLYNNQNAIEVLEKMFLRSLKKEFDQY